jgi:hypothetical protein
MTALNRAMCRLMPVRATQTGPNQAKQTHPTPSQTIPNHPKPSQTIPNHPKPSQTIPNHPKKTIEEWKGPFRDTQGSNSEELFTLQDPY